MTTMFAIALLLLAILIRLIWIGAQRLAASAAKYLVQEFHL